jgi:hypothetical protein
MLESSEKYILNIRHQSAEPARLLWYMEVLYTPKPLGIRAVYGIASPKPASPQIFFN